MLTIEGMWLLLRIKRRKVRNKLPENWEGQVVNYINNKRTVVKIFNRQWDKEQLNIAKNIARILGVEYE